MLKMNGFNYEKEIKIAGETLSKDTIKLMEKCLTELTTTGSPFLDTTLVKQFKRLCRESDDYVRYAFLLIMRHLNRKHSEVRLSAFQVADELFNRSHAFREMLVTHLQAFLALTTETETERPLPPPRSAANRLKTDTLHALQLWYDKYGQGYKKLAVGYNYLKNCKHVDFDNIRAENQAQRQRIENEEKRKQKIMADKLTKVLKVISELKPEINNCLREAESCLQLLLPTLTDFILPPSEEVGTDQSKDQTNITETNKQHQESQEFCSGHQDQLAGRREDVFHSESSGSCKSVRPKEPSTCPDMQHDQRPNMLCLDSSLEVTSNPDLVSKSDNDQLHSNKADYIVNSWSKADGLCELSLPVAGNSVCVSNRSDDIGVQTTSESSVLNEAATGSCNYESGDDSDTENVAEMDADQDDLHAHGLPNPFYNLVIEIPGPGPVSVQVTTDNTDVARSLKDASKLIINNYLPKVTKWLEVLGKNGAKEEDIKAAIDLKIQLGNIKMKCTELKLLPMKLEMLKDEDVSDEDEFEEVLEKEGYEPHIPEHLRAEYGLDALSGQVKTVQPQLPVEKNYLLKSSDKAESWNQSKQASTSKHWSLKGRIKAENVSDPTSLASALARIKSESTETGLKSMPSSSTTNQTSPEMQRATDVPVVQFGTDLAFWENPDKIEAPSVVKLDSLHRFWTPKENEPEKPSQDIADVKNRAFYFTGKFEPVKWRCRALLPNGKLCERMDRVKCPFHGKIIPRGQDGKPNGDNQPSTSQEGHVKKEFLEQINTELPPWQDPKLPPWQDPELQREIEQATGHDLGSARSQKLLDKKAKGKGKSKAKKKSNLTDTEAIKNTPRKRLEGRIFNKRSMKRVCSTLDNADYRRVRDKFTDQFNYSLH